MKEQKLLPQWTQTTIDDSAHNVYYKYWSIFNRQTEKVKSIEWNVHSGGMKITSTYGRVINGKMLPDQNEIAI